MDFSGREIVVTKEHWMMGIREHCALCPIAIAIYAALGIEPERRGTSKTVVEVNYESIKVYDQRYSTPEHIEQAMRSFDRGEKKRKNFRELRFVLEGKTLTKRGK